MGFHSVVKQRCWALVLMLSLLTLHLYLTFSAQQQMRAGTLHSGDYSVIHTMERTFDNALPPTKSDRTRVRFAAVFETLAALKIASERIDVALSFAPQLYIYGLWELLVGRTLTSEPHSDLVLRI